MKTQNLKPKTKKFFGPKDHQGPLVVESVLKELRCSKCHKLFAKEDIKEGFLEVKCHRCGSIERFSFKAKKR